jgi:hypothetical protein
MVAILIVAQKQFFGVLFPQEPQDKRGHFGRYFPVSQVSILNQILRLI